MRGTRPVVVAAVALGGCAARPAQPPAVEPSLPVLSVPASSPRQDVEPEAGFLRPIVPEGDWIVGHPPGCECFNWQPADESSNASMKSKRR